MKFLVRTAKKGADKPLYLQSFNYLKGHFQPKRTWTYDFNQALIFNDFEIASHEAMMAYKAQLFLIDEGGLLFQISSVAINPTFNSKVFRYGA